MSISTYWINERLGWRVQHTESGWELYNEWGYCGSYATLERALGADNRMGADVTSN